MKIISYNISWCKQEKIDWLVEHRDIDAFVIHLQGEDRKGAGPTYYHQYKESAPFFLDYAFTNAEVKDYKLYTWNESGKMSDHVPLMLEI